MNTIIEANLINISSKIELLRNIADTTKEEVLKDSILQTANELERSVCSIERVILEKNR
jgi:hypothetical protein